MTSFSVVIWTVICKEDLPGITLAVCLSANNCIQSSSANQNTRISGYLGDGNSNQMTNYVRSNWPWAEMVMPLHFAGALFPNNSIQFQILESIILHCSVAVFQISCQVFIFKLLKCIGLNSYTLSCSKPVDLFWCDLWQLNNWNQCYEL